MRRDGDHMLGKVFRTDIPGKRKIENKMER